MKRALPLSSFSSISPEWATATRGRVQLVINKQWTVTVVEEGGCVLMCDIILVSWEAEEDWEHSYSQLYSAQDLFVVEN
jgi:hypothetical protein